MTQPIFTDPTEEAFVLQKGAMRNVIFETPHLGRIVPDEFRGHSQLVSTAKQRWDIGIDKAGDYLLKKTGGEWLASTTSRMVVDLNRGVDRVDQRVCPRWPGARIHQDGGVIVPFTRTKKSMVQLYSKPLHPDEVEFRLKYYWYPYHDELNQRLKIMQRRYGSAILICLHSAEPEPQHQRSKHPVIYLGTCNGQTCNEEILGALCNALEKRDIMVISEGFYQGAFTNQAYGIEDNVQAIQIELDRRYLDTEKNLISQLEPVSYALKSVSISGTSPTTSGRRNRSYSSRTYVDPITGDILLY
jgi:N-formylglutamate deformylase